MKRGMMVVLAAVMLSASALTGQAMAGPYKDGEKLVKKAEKASAAKEWAKAADYYERALVKFKKQQKKDPKHKKWQTTGADSSIVITLHDLGYMYLKLPNYEKCIQVFQRIEPDERWARGYGRLGYCFGKLKRNPEAFQAAKQAVRLSPYDSTWLKNAAIYARRVGDRSAGDYERRADLAKRAKAIRRGRSGADVHQKRAELYRREGDRGGYEYWMMRSRSSARVRRGQMERDAEGEAAYAEGRRQRAEWEDVLRVIGSIGRDPATSPPPAYTPPRGAPIDPPVIHSGTGSTTISGIGGFGSLIANGRDVGSFTVQVDQRKETLTDMSDTTRRGQTYETCEATVSVHVQNATICRMDVGMDAPDWKFGRRLGPGATATGPVSTAMGPEKKAFDYCPDSWKVHWQVTVVCD